METNIPPLTPGDRVVFVNTPPGSLSSLVSATPAWLLGKEAMFVENVPTPVGNMAKVVLLENGTEQILYYQWIAKN